MGRPSEFNLTDTSCPFFGSWSLSNKIKHQTIWNIFRQASATMMQSEMVIPAHPVFSRSTKGSWRSSS